MPRGGKKREEMDARASKLVKGRIDERKRLARHERENSELAERLAKQFLDESLGLPEPKDLSLARVFSEKDLTTWVFLGEVSKLYPSVLEDLRREFDQIEPSFSNDFRAVVIDAGLIDWLKDRYLLTESTLREVLSTWFAWTNHRVVYPDADVPLKWGFELRMTAGYPGPGSDGIVRFPLPGSFFWDQSKETASDAVERLGEILDDAKARFEELAYATNLKEAFSRAQEKENLQHHRWLAHKQVGGKTYKEITSEKKVHAATQAVYRLAKRLGLIVRGEVGRPKGRTDSRESDRARDLV